MAIDMNVFEQNDVKVEVITLSGSKEYQVTENTTVKEFKRLNNLQGVVIVDADGDVLRDTDTITEDIQVFVSAPKKNG